MEIKQHILNWLGVQKRSKTSAVNFIGNNDYTYRLASTEVASLMETVQSNPWVYAALYVLSTAPTQVDYMLRKTPSRGGAEVDSVEVQKFLQQPNPHQSWEDFIISLMMSLELTGDAYIEWVQDAQVTEAYVLRSDRMTIQPSRHARIAHYTYRANGREVIFDAEDIIHVMWPNPNDDLYGLAPIKAVERDLTAEYYAQAYNQQFFKNGARIDGVLQSEHELDDQSYERLKAEWKKAYSGVDQAHRTAILENGMSYKAIAATPKDMDFQNMRKWNREAVLAALGVPPAMVGIFEYANYANADVQKRIFWEETMLPKLRKLESALTKVLQQLFGEDIYFFFDHGSIPSLQHTQHDMVKSISTMVRDGVLDIDEARAKLGLPSKKTENAN